MKKTAGPPAAAATPMTSDVQGLRLPTSMMIPTSLMDGRYRLILLGGNDAGDEPREKKPGPALFV
jgi:hypothetical protein